MIYNENGEAYFNPTEIRKILKENNRLLNDFYHYKNLLGKDAKDLLCYIEKIKEKIPSEIRNLDGCTGLSDLSLNKLEKSVRGLIEGK